MSQEALDLKDHLKSLEMFIASPAYVGYIAAQDAEEALLDMRILNDDYNTLDGMIELAGLKGERRQVVEAKRIFEDARVTLKERISKVTDRDIENTETKV